MILSGYMGGGTHNIRLIDLGSGEILANANISGNVYPGRPVGAPFEIYFSGPVIGLLTPSKQPEMSLFAESEYARMIPAEGLEIYKKGGMHYLGWHPTKDRLIVVMESQSAPDGPVTDAQILEWDLESDRVVRVAQGAVNVQYSQDGRWLALTTLGEIALNPDRMIRAGGTHTIPKNAQTFLYIIDTASGKVRLHLPVVSHVNGLDFFIPIYEPHAALSPDGQSLAIITRGRVVIEDGSMRVDGNKDSPFFLNIIDLETLALTANALTTEESMPLWSPQSEMVFYWAEPTKPAVLDLARGQAMLLSAEDGLTVFGAAWSYNGAYISLQTHPTEEYQDASQSTRIYQVLK